MRVDSVLDPQRSSSSAPTGGTLRATSGRAVALLMHLHKYVTDRYADLVLPNIVRVDRARQAEC